MAAPHLTIDLNAVARNWRDLDHMTRCETAAVVKANAYGLGAGRVARRLIREGARTFFVATTEEGSRLRADIGPEPVIHVFAGHMEGDAAELRAFDLTPVLNSIEQMVRHFEALPGRAFSVQLDTGMNRLGLEPAEWRAVRDLICEQRPRLVMSHLACSDEAEHDMNIQQLSTFNALTRDLDVPKSLAATGGTILGPDFHFDLCRPGIGLYGGLPYVDASPVVTLDIPVIQFRDVAVGETVGYGNSWTAARPTRLATISAGYADGLIRAMGPKAMLHADNVPVPVVGRVSMDLITVDVTDLGRDPDSLQLIGAHQSVDTVAEMAGTIGYEILTGLSARYHRHIVG